MKTFALGMIVGFTLAGAVVWAQNWQSFEGTVFQDAARNEQLQRDLEQQRQQFELSQQRERDRQERDRQQREMERRYQDDMNTRAMIQREQDWWRRQDQANREIERRSQMELNEADAIRRPR